jgi:NodT family efflux transporter outer membrane factor (OMF) lipoprotein
MPLAELAGAASRGRAEPGAPIATAGSLALQASWEIDLFGAVRAGVDAGQARLEGAEAAWHGARVSLAAEVATAYVGLRGCEALLAEQEVDARSRAETARVTERSAQAGVTAPAAAAQARASAAQARSQVVAQRAQCDSQVKALVALTADAEPGLRQRLASRTGQIPAAAPIAFDTLPARLLAQRPDLAEAAAQVTAAAADQRLADARRWPRVSLGGSFGYMDVRTPGVHQDGSTWSFGPLQVSFPVFDGGVRRANQQAARSAYDEAVVQYQAKLRTAVREVEDALLQLRSTADRQADARAAADGFETSFKAAETRYQGGVASLFELEDARRTLVAARSVVVELQRERTSAWISLYRALGGGWQSAGATTAAQAS